MIQGLIISVVTIFLSIFSTGVLSYISMATPIGPWIAPTLVLIATILFKTIFCFIRQKSEAIALCTLGGSVGGIVATAIGFSFPTLYFLDPVLFNDLLASPFTFSVSLGLLSFAAGYLGFIIANILEPQFIVQDNMAFPIGQLVYKMIAAQDQAKKALQLGTGLISSFIFCMLQGGVGSLKAIIPEQVILSRGRDLFLFNIPTLSINFSVLPMLLAIGFISGHIIAIPLIIGTITKIIIIDPLNTTFFASINSFDFLFAFASGMVLMGAVLSFAQFPQMLIASLKKIKNNKSTDKWRHSFKNNMKQVQQIIKMISLTEFIVLCVALLTFFIYFKFSVFQALYLTIATYACSYQIALIAGKIGLAQLGRFATFVMVPALFLFGTYPVHATLIAAFVEICAGVTTDILFGRKMARLAHMDLTIVKLIQWFGLVISCLCVGIICWLLISHFGLGSPELFAQRAQARALLINVKSFNIPIVILGILYGFILKYVRLNPMLVLSGLLMPLNFSLGLIAGGILTYWCKNTAQWEPFWSGVFGANSIWMLLRTIF